jgi:hypothetical protein
VQLVAFADRPTAAGAGAAPKSDGSTRALAAEEIIEEYVGDALGMDGGAGVSDATISSPLLSVSTAVRCALMFCFFPHKTSDPCIGAVHGTWMRTRTREWGTQRVARRIPAAAPVRALLFSPPTLLVPKALFILRYHAFHKCRLSFARNKVGGRGKSVPCLLPLIMCCLSV